MTSAISAVSMSLLLLGKGRKKPDMSLFSDLHLICQTFSVFLWLEAHHTWDTGLCVYSLHGLTSCQIPALALRDTFLCVLSPLCAVSVPLLVSLSAADPCLLLQCVMLCKNHLYLHSTCSKSTCCGCRFCLSEQELPAVSLREGSGFLGALELPLQALCLQRALCCSQPLRLPGQWMHSLSLSEACRGMKHYPFPDVCSSICWKFCSSPLNMVPLWGTTHLWPDRAGNAPRRRSAELGQPQGLELLCRFFYFAG